MQGGERECERLHPVEKEAVCAFVERSGLAYGAINVSIQVKAGKPDRVAIETRRDVIGKSIE